MQSFAEARPHVASRPRGDVLIAHLADAMWQGAAPGRAPGSVHQSSCPSQPQSTGASTAAAQIMPLSSPRQRDTANLSLPLSDQGPSRPHMPARKSRLTAAGLFCPVCISGVGVCAFHTAEDPCRAKTVERGLRAEASEWVPGRCLLSTAPGATESGSQPHTATDEQANHRQQQSSQPPSTVMSQPPPPPMMAPPRPPLPPPLSSSHQWVAGVTADELATDDKQTASQWLDHAYLDKDDEDSSTDVGCSEPGDTESGSSDALQPQHPHAGMLHPLQQHKQGNVSLDDCNGLGGASCSTEAISSVYRYHL